MQSGFPEFKIYNVIQPNKKVETDRKAGNEKKIKLKSEQLKKTMDLINEQLKTCQIAEIPKDDGFLKIGMKFFN